MNRITSVVVTTVAAGLVVGGGVAVAAPSGKTQEAKENRSATTQVEPFGDAGERLAGADRYATAVEISRYAWDETTASTVYVANGLASADALAGGFIQFADGPLLFVRQNTVPEVTMEEIERLQPCNVVVLGGEGVVSEQVALAVEAMADPTRCDI